MPDVRRVVKKRKRKPKRVYLRRFDVLVIVILLALSGLAYLGVTQLFSKKGSTVKIEVNGKISGEYPLNEDATIPVRTKGGASNVITIKGGVVYMEKADCPDKLCMKQGKKKKRGETIICLPNKVVVTVTDDGKQEMDTMTN